MLDGANADLWNAGLNLTIRHSTEYYPHHENSPICTVVLKETIFQDLVGLNGEALNMAVINSLLGSDADQSLFYEVKEVGPSVDCVVQLSRATSFQFSQIMPYKSEEILPLISLAGAVRGGQITPETCGNSRLISRVLSKYYVTGGIHCLGDFANVRHVFQWKGIRLEVDKCKFPHDEGYFVRFDPDDAVALQL